MNQITLIGNLSTAPDKKAVKGTTVVTFNLAVNNGESTDFFRINAWRGLGDNCFKYLDKGSKVAVVGKLRPNKYKSKSGENMISLDVTAEEVEFLTPKKPVADEFSDVNEDDLPF